MSRYRVFSTCGIPWAKKHQPHCTEEFRADDGCWCFLRDGKPLRAREWRAQRRQAVRYRRSWMKGWKP